MLDMNPSAATKSSGGSELIPYLPANTDKKKDKLKTDDSIEKTILQKRREDLYIEGFTGNDWGDKITFTVGVSYFGAGLFGLVKGIFEGFPKNWKLPKKLILNNFFNAVGRSSARYGNACAAASLMYCLVGGTMNFLFEDEVAQLTPVQKNMLCGAITGGLYKSTLGVRPMIVGSLLGGLIIFNLHHVTAYLNRKELIHFEMKF